jgi:LPXTG-motif cell wall-anchored protein
LRVAAIQVSRADSPISQLGPAGSNPRRSMLIPIVGVLVVAGLVLFLVMRRKKVSH